ncbi:hypothetical protein BDM02DRAFT_3104903 [Thelephora ganbajun]|uniref:Uncharacterized protein n=1 Tax=Thelephora ganbajun TaxID=370292 RepID=A0ACB6Z019_THEGA|nr:hypothetical protein BDM02DRAFT_3104903 [Thelephora ganbajun]
MKNTVTKQEVDAFDPNLGPCCNATNFRVHLGGTTCNAWNKSAINAFVNDFLSSHSEYPSQEESIRETVGYRKSHVPHTVEESDELKLQKNRQERKRKLYHRHRNVTFLYPSLASQRQLLEQLTSAGMSSDEERLVGHYKQYEVVEPVWRSDIVTAWLRIFDAVYAYARRSKVYGDQRGSAPRVRMSRTQRSTSRKFVPGLPRNAYDDMWFKCQIHPEDTVRLGPDVLYYHDARTIE